MTTESIMNTCACPLANLTIILAIAVTPLLSSILLAMVIVASPTYPEKFVLDNVVAPFLQLSVVVVTHSL